VGGRNRGRGNAKRGACNRALHPIKFSQVSLFLQSSSSSSSSSFHPPRILVKPHRTALSFNPSDRNFEEFYLISQNLRLSFVFCANQYCKSRPLLAFPRFAIDHPFRDCRSLTTLMPRALSMISNLEYRDHLVLCKGGVRCATSEGEHPSLPSRSDSSSTDVAMSEISASDAKSTSHPNSQQAAPRLDGSGVCS
jgi:hypothetical protein